MPNSKDSVWEALEKRFEVQSMKALLKLGDKLNKLMLSKLINSQFLSFLFGQFGRSVPAQTCWAFRYSEAHNEVYGIIW